MLVWASGVGIGVASLVLPCATARGDYVWVKQIQSPVQRREMRQVMHRVRESPASSLGEMGPCYLGARGRGGRWCTAVHHEAPIPDRQDASAKWNYRFIFMPSHSQSERRGGILG